MIRIRKSSERGHFDHGWLKTFHTFSFADYHDPKHMHFSSLRVINEDWVQPREGFGTHGHKNMEIVTYVLSGALEHKDSMGNGSVIRPSEVQYMSAGSGVTHSEFNHSESELVHLIQIWILPDQQGLKPSYDQKTFQDAEKLNQLKLIVSGTGKDGSIRIHQDIRVYASILEPKQSQSHEFAKGRCAWVQALRGSVQVGENTLSEGDGAAIEGEKLLSLSSTSEKPEFLLFDLPV